ncbi:hypothetical protein FRC07_008398 [Ceratobasidium sp. 392]|nr:hypothetical protein FRC07_008398 [Ceratobasidium sp. 392]
MECETYGCLEWVLSVKPEDLRDFEAMVRKECGSASAVSALVVVPIPRQPAEPRKQPAADYANANPFPFSVSTSPSASHSNSTSPVSSTC